MKMIKKSNYEEKDDKRHFEVFCHRWDIFANDLAMKKEVFEEGGFYLVVFVVVVVDSDDDDEDWTFTFSTEYIDLMKFQMMM